MAWSISREGRRSVRERATGPGEGICPSLPLLGKLLVSRGEGGAGNERERRQCGGGGVPTIGVRDGDGERGGEGWRRRWEMEWATTG
jgi:hypothetical protein